MSIAKDMAALRERDPLFRCAYCATALALPWQQVSTGDWEADGWELYLLLDDEYVWQLLDGHSLAHRDHVQPKSKGGPDDIDNLVLACEACNLEKKAYSLLLFFARRAGLPRFRSVGDAPAAPLAHSLSRRAA